MLLMTSQGKEKLSNLICASLCTMYSQNDQMVLCTSLTCYISNVILHCSLLTQPILYCVLLSHSRYRWSQSQMDQQKNKQVLCGQIIYSYQKLLPSYLYSKKNYLFHFSMFRWIKSKKTFSFNLFTFMSIHMEHPVSL